MSENAVNTTYSELVEAIKSLNLPEPLLFSEPLKKYTTWRVGGPADLFVEVKSSDSLLKLTQAAAEHGTPVFVLGGGSNILVGDKGFRGLVIRNGYAEMEVIGDKEGTVEQKIEYGKLISRWEDHSTGEARHTAVHFHYYTDESDPNFEAEPIFLRVSSGYLMASFIRETLDKGYTGLEWFTRIPGTLGGWIYNNVHGHTQFIGDFLLEVRSITSTGEIITRSWKELDFGYDQSLFHTNNEIILDATMRLFKGDAQKAKEIAVETMKNKLQRQPSNSAGCVFHNVTADEKVQNNFESDAAGYIVDKKLGWLGGHKVGGAWISAKHGNFIETDGTATAADILAVMEEIKVECKKRYNIDLREEIFRVGEF